MEKAKVSPKQKKAKNPSNMRKARRFISVEEKEKILNEIDKMMLQGKSYADIAKELNMQRQFVRNMYINRKRVRNHLKLSNNLASNVIKSCWWLYKVYLTNRFFYI